MFMLCRKNYLQKIVNCYKTFFFSAVATGLEPPGAYAVAFIIIYILLAKN